MTAPVSVEQPTEAPATVEYHAILTMQKPQTGHFVSFDVTMDVPAGTSRQAIYHHVVDTFIQRDPKVDGGVPVFFSLEPNELGGAS